VADRAGPTNHGVRRIAACPRVIAGPLTATPGKPACVRDVHTVRSRCRSPPMRSIFLTGRRGDRPKAIAASGIARPGQQGTRVCSIRSRGLRGPRGVLDRKARRCRAADPARRPDAPPTSKFCSRWPMPNAAPRARPRFEHTLPQMLRREQGADPESERWRGHHRHADAAARIQRPRRTRVLCRC